MCRKYDYFSVRLIFISLMNVKVVFLSFSEINRSYTDKVLYPMSLYQIIKETFSLPNYERNILKKKSASPPPAPAIYRMFFAEKVGEILFIRVASAIVIYALSAILFKSG